MASVDPYLTNVLKINNYYLLSPEWIAFIIFLYSWGNIWEYSSKNISVRKCGGMLQQDIQDVSSICNNHCRLELTEALSTCTDYLPTYSIYLHKAEPANNLWINESFMKPYTSLTDYWKLVFARSRGYNFLHWSCH